VRLPQGPRKRLGFVRNTIVGPTDRVAHYLTDTQQGSSGSSVLHAQGQVIALHHASGTPQEVAGKQPLQKHEGLRISRVPAALIAKGLLTDLMCRTAGAVRSWRTMVWATHVT
jgi:endonuclease G